MRPTAFKYILVVYFLVACWPVFATEGPGGSGGGDTDAVEFIRIGRSIVSSLKQPGAITIDVSVDQIAAKLNELEQGLNLTSASDAVPRAILKFTRDTIFDSHGVEKQGLFNREMNSIFISRVHWRLMTEIQKFELVVIELAGLAGSQKRYSNALLVSADLMARAHLERDEVMLCGRKIKRSNVKFETQGVQGGNSEVHTWIGQEVGLWAGFSQIKNGNDISVTFCPSANHFVMLIELYDQPEQSIYAELFPIIPRR